MFINGLSLGCLWGIIFSFMEGRRLTDILAGLLGVSMVISFATAKSLGLYLMQALYVSECWMPVLIGAFALPVLALLGGCVGEMPLPTVEDTTMKSRREALDSAQC